MKTRFFTYIQINSGGNFDVRTFDGIAHFVIVEANNAKHANKRAKEIGLYFNGVRKGIDCPCCGDRWSKQSKGYSEPCINDCPAHLYERSHFFKYRCFVHYLNGDVKEIELKMSEREIEERAKEDAVKSYEAYAIDYYVNEKSFASICKIKDTGFMTTMNGKNFMRSNAVKEYQVGDKRKLTEEEINKVKSILNASESIDWADKVIY